MNCGVYAMLSRLQKALSTTRLDCVKPRTDSVGEGSQSRESPQYPTTTSSEPESSVESGLTPKLQQVLVQADVAPTEQTSFQPSSPPAPDVSSESRTSLQDASGTGFSRGHHFDPTVDVILYMENMGQRWLKARPGLAVFPMPVCVHPRAHALCLLYVGF